MDNFFSELKRRNVVRVAIAYGVVGWVVLQFVDVIADPMALPDWFQKVTIIFLAIGFPIALIVSWAFEVTPEGVMKTAEVDKSKSVTHGTGQKINYLIIGGLVIAVGFLLFERSTTPNQRVAPASAGTVSIAVMEKESRHVDFFRIGILVQSRKRARQVVDEVLAEPRHPRGHIGSRGVVQAQNV